MTRDELTNWAWKWGRHIDALTFLLVLALIAAMAWVVRQ